MSPWIASIHAHQVPIWLLLQITALCAMLTWFFRRTRGEPSGLRLALVLALPGAALGALGLGIVLRLPAFVASGFEPRRLFGMGVMAYGALGGLVGTYAAVVRIRGGAVASALDRLAPALGLLVLFGRTGCLFAGCDFGRVSGMPWAMRYPRGTAAFLEHVEQKLIPASAEYTLPVHPAQAYEAALGLLMAGVGLVVERKKLRPGTVFASVAGTYAAGRFLTDLFRGDSRPMLGPLSMPQWLSITVLACVVLWATGAPRGER
ncbi:prolipoprotein diacylglyceryl transferase family protein [Polyangium sp. y55x31]|uniref:prolipoprotein diacylglyceryl transferase n=1 Tax=Polyangium sp. y55x31 TaxID=3042688 RepID=UPI00248260F0|nr:prolipoprotein diacylglyceryl transferase family protein [Polyangium sp. y55x31]MDI1475354.1 prolipoprotein diacylglyceryl transferase [Polyangium sp. y55x31]